MPTEKSVSQPPISCVYPAIGKGNVLEARTAATYLGTSHDISLIEIKSPLTDAAQTQHSRMSRDLHRQLMYAADSSIRSSWIAKLLSLSMAYQASNTDRLNGSQKPLYLTSQDLLARELANQGNLVALLYPDCLSKFSTENPPYSNMHHLVWSEEAYNLAANHLGTDAHVHLIKPLNHRHLLRDTDVLQPHTVSGVSTLDTCLVPISGSGGDADFISQATTSLFKEGMQSILISAHKPTLLEVEDKMFGYIATLSDPLGYYRLTANPNLEYRALLSPNECLKDLALISSSRNIKVVMLPPRGSHEVQNLIFGLRHNIVSTVCIPDHLASTLRSILYQNGYDTSIEPIQLVDPNKLSRHHFARPQQWTPPPHALSLNEAITKIYATR